MLRAPKYIYIFVKRNNLLEVFQPPRLFLLANKKCARVRISSATLFRPWVIGPCELKKKKVGSEMYLESYEQCVARGSTRRLLTILDASSSKVHILFVRRNNLLSYFSHVTEIAQHIIPSNEQGEVSASRGTSCRSRVRKLSAKLVNE